MERASIDIFHDQEDLLVRFKRLVEFGQTFVINFFHDFDFSFDAFPSIRFEQLELVINLNGDFLVEQFVQPYPDNGVGALPNPLAYDVIVDVFDGTELSAKLVHLTVQVHAWVLRILVLVHLVSKMGVVVVHLVLFLEVIALLACGWRDKSSLLPVLEATPGVFLVLSVREVSHSVHSATGSI